MGSEMNPIDRRDFIKVSGLLSGGVALGAWPGRNARAADVPAKKKPPAKQNNKKQLAKTKAKK